MDVESWGAPMLEPASTPPATPAETNIAQFVMSIDALHFKHFHGTRLGNDTELWNQVHAFKEALKAHAIETLTAAPGA